MQRIVLDYFCNKNSNTINIEIVFALFIYIVLTVEPRFNEPLHNKDLGITNGILQPGQSYSKIYGTEPRYNEILDITNTIENPKCN